MIRTRSFVYALFVLQPILLACNNLTGKQSEGDPTSAIELNDSIMNQAIVQARETLPTFKTALTTDTAASLFSLKLKYPTRSGHEHIWISQVKMVNGQMRGVVDNSANDIPSLQVGDTISVSEEKISDWMFKRSDSIHGGFTIRVLRNRMNETERAELDHSVGYPFAGEQ